MTPESPQQPEDDGNRRYRMVASWVLLLAIVLICVSVFIAYVRGATVTNFWLPIAQEHFAAVVGLPMAALASLCIVLIVRTSSGRLEFEAWGLKFKGAAAPIVFWVLCYLAMAVSIKLLW